MKRLEKEIFVKNLTRELTNAKSVILVNYAGMSVKHVQALKAKLSEVDAKMLVSKNTLFAIAAKEANLSSEIADSQVLTGQTAIVVSENEDPISALSILGRFAKEFEVPQMKVGVVEGVFQGQDELIHLSTLPGKDALVAQVLGTIASPLYGVVGTLEGNLQKLLFILNEASKKA